MEIINSRSLGGGAPQKVTSNSGTGNNTNSMGQSFNGRSISSGYGASTQNLTYTPSVSQMSPYAAALQNPYNNLINYEAYSRSSGSSNSVNANTTQNNWNGRIRPGEYYPDATHVPEVTVGNPIASLINAGVAFFEGVVSYVENVSDAYYMVDSMQTAGSCYESARIASLLGEDDLAKRYGELGDYFSDQKQIVEHVATDYTDVLFDSFYSTSVMNNINDNAGDIWKRENSKDGKDGLGYSIMQGVGEYAPSIVASSLGGAPLQAFSVATNSYGKNLEKNYNNMIKTSEKTRSMYDSSDVFDASLRAGISATVDGGTVLSAGIVKNNINNKIKVLLNEFDESLGLPLDPLNKTYANYFGTDASIVVKALKPFVNEMIDTFGYKVDETGVDSTGKLTDGPDGNVDKFDWAGCFQEAVVIIGAEKVSNIIGNFLSQYKTDNILINVQEKTNIEGIETDAISYNFHYNILNSIADNKIVTDITKRIAKDTVGKVTDEVLGDG